MMAKGDRKCDRIGSAIIIPKIKVTGYATISFHHFYEGKQLICSWTKKPFQNGGS